MSTGALDGRGLRPAVDSDGLSLTAGRVSEAARWGTRTMLLVLALTSLRAIGAAAIALSDTEAYYASWSRFLDWSYYDHPPIIAWATWLTTRGSTAPLAVRAAPIVCTVIHAVLVYRLSARLFSPRAGFLAVLMLTVMPGFLLGNVLVNPESFLAPVWILCLTLLDDLRAHDEPWRPLALGAAIGLAFLCKYTGVLAVPISLLYLASSPATRRWLARPSLYAGGLVALAVASPVLAWNAAHGWPTLTLHLTQRAGVSGLHALAQHALALGISQIFLYHPLFIPALIVTVVVMLRRARADARYRLLACGSVPVLAFFAFVMLRLLDSEPHWTMSAIFPLGIAASGLADERLDRAPRFFRAYASTAALVSVLAGVLAIVHARTPVLVRLVPDWAYAPDWDPANELIGWDRVTAAVREEVAHLGPRVVVASHHNVLCGHLALELDDRPHVYCPSPRRTELDFVGRRDPPPSAPVVFVDSLRYPADPSALLPGRACRRVHTIDLRRDGRFMGQYRVHVCR